MTLEDNEVVWIDGLNPVLDFINFIKDSNPEPAEECFAFMRNENLPRKNYNVVLDDKELFITIIKINDDFRVIISSDIELIDLFLKEESEVDNNL